MFPQTRGPRKLLFGGCCALKSSLGGKDASLMLQQLQTSPILFSTLRHIWDLCLGKTDLRGGWAADLFDVENHYLFDVRHISAGSADIFRFVIDSSCKHFSHKK